MLNIVANNKAIIEKTKKGQKLTIEESLSLAQAVMELNYQLTRIETIGLKASLGHGKDCPCALCFLTNISRGQA